MFLFKGGTKSWLLRIKFQYKTNLLTVFRGVSHFPQLSVIILFLFNRKNDVQSRSFIVTPQPSSYLHGYWRQAGGEYLS
jgi:hypothetical protein